MNRIKKLFSGVLVMAMTISVLPGTAEGAKAPKLSTKRVVLKEGQKKIVKLKNGVAKAKVTWTISNKKVAKLSKKVSKGNKASVTVTAAKKGTAKLTAKYKVSGKVKNISASVIVSEKVQPTSAPTSTPMVTATIVPSPSVQPAATPTVTPSPTATPTSFVPIKTFLEDTDYDVPAGYDKVDSANEGELVNIEYPSTVIKEGEIVMRKAIVGLPKDYDESKKYPVIYVNHGIGGNETSMAGGNFKNVLWNAVADGVAEEAIMVFGSCCANEYNGQGPNPFFSLEHYEGYNNYLNDLEQCLMPYINENYSTYTDRAHTAVCGFSMGGRVSLHLGFAMQDTFRYVGAFCPAPGILDFTDNGVTGPGLFTPETFTLQDKYMDDTLVLIFKGIEDNVVKTFPKEYHDALEKNKVPHIYNEMHGGHDASVHNPAFYNFVRRIFKEEK